MKPIRLHLIKEWSLLGLFWISDLAIIDDIDASAIHVLLSWADFMDEIDG